MWLQVFRFWLAFPFANTLEYMLLFLFPRREISETSEETEGFLSIITERDLCISFMKRMKNRAKRAVIHLTFINFCISYAHHWSTNIYGGFILILFRKISFQKLITTTPCPYLYICGCAYVCVCLTHCFNSGTTKAKFVKSIERNAHLFHLWRKLSTSSYEEKNHLRFISNGFSY